MRSTQIETEKSHYQAMCVGLLWFSTQCKTSAKCNFLFFFSFYARALVIRLEAQVCNSIFRKHCRCNREKARLLVLELEILLEPRCLMLLVFVNRETTMLFNIYHPRKRWHYKRAFEVALIQMDLRGHKFCGMQFGNLSLQHRNIPNLGFKYTSIYVYH